MEGTIGNAALAAQLSSIMGDDALYAELARRGYFKGSAEEVKAHLESILAKDAKGTETSSTASGPPSPEGKVSEELTEAEIEDLETFVSEGTAIMAEKILGDGHFIRRLVVEQGSVAEKILLRLTELKESLSRMTSKDAKSLHRAVVKAEGLYLKAVEEAGYRFEGGKFVGSEEEEVKESYKVVDETEVSEPYKDFEIEDYYQNGEMYTYNFLTSQAPMNKVLLPELHSLQKEGLIDKSIVVSKGMENALTEGKDVEGKTYVKNRYTGRYYRVDVGSIRHGLNGDGNRLKTNSRIGAVVGTVVKNAIPINGLKNTSDIASGTYAMVGQCYDLGGREIVVVVTVEHRTGDIIGMDAYDVTHSLSGRQNNRDKLVGTKPQGVNPSKPISVTVSISQLLENVNSTYQSILSDDVLRALGEKRNPDGYYSGRVLFSRKPKSQTSVDLENPPTELTGAQRQIVAEHSRPKVYTRAEAVSVIDDIVKILEEVYNEEGGIGEDSGFVALKKKTTEHKKRPEPIVYRLLVWISTVWYGQQDLNLHS